MARMLEMLQIEEGQNVLEIGAATGYNAALLKELIGRHGHVTTVEVQPDLASGARQHLEAAGYRSNLDVIVGDGRLGYTNRAPFDRIVATTSSDQVPVSWWDQLKPGGVLVIPYRWNNAQAVFALRRTPDGFESERATIGGFMPIHSAQGRPSDARFVGPRQDVAVSPARLPKTLDLDILFRLLISEPRTDLSEALGKILTGEGTGAWRQQWDFRCFLAVRAAHLLEITARNPVYGFRFGLALADTSLPSLAVLASSGQPALPRERPTAFHLVGFGTEAMYSRFEQLVEEYIAMGMPVVDNLKLTLERGRSGKHWRRTFTY